MYYRVRTKIGGLNGEMVVVKDYIPSMVEAYEIIAKEGKGTTRHYYLDVIEPRLFSKCTAKIALQRIDEIRMNKENEENDR